MGLFKDMIEIMKRFMPWEDVDRKLFVVRSFRFMLVYSAINIICYYTDSHVISTIGLTFLETLSSLLNLCYYTCLSSLVLEYLGLNLDYSRVLKVCDFVFKETFGLPASLFYSSGYKR